MKKIGLVLVVLIISVALSSVASADLLIRDSNLNPCLKADTLQMEAKVKYSGLCSKCGHNWTTTTKPTKCPNCGYVGIVYYEYEASENTVNKEQLVASENCVCAECNKKCGTGHETWCSSYQKPKAMPTIENELVAWNINIELGASCIEEGLQCTLHGTPCCAPYTCKGKFPNTYCQ